MNYIAHLNAYFDSILINTLSSNAQALYTNLFNIYNRCNWSKWFTVPNTVLCASTGLSRVALDRARNELKQKGYIDYQKGKGNQAGKYLIVDFDAQNDTQFNTQNDTQLLYKVNTLNKQKQKEDNYIYNIYTRVGLNININILNNNARQQLELYKQIVYELVYAKKEDYLVGVDLNVLENYYEKAIENNVLDKNSYIKKCLENRRVDYEYRNET